MFSTVNHLQTRKAGRVKLTVALNTNYCKTFKIFEALSVVELTKELIFTSNNLIRELCY